MNEGDRILVKKGAQVFFSFGMESKAYAMTMDRDYHGIVLNIYPDGSPRNIEFVGQMTVSRGINWEEGKDYEVVE